MKRDFLKELGLEKDVIDKILDENGKDLEQFKGLDAKVAALEAERDEFRGQVEKRDADLTKLQNKLTAAKEDATKLADAQTALAELKTQYETDKNDWDARSKQQAYEFAVKTAANGVKFSSKAAKNEFTRSAIEAGFKMDGDDLLGWTDFVDKYKAADPEAFLVEKEAAPAESSKPAASVVLPTNKDAGTGGDGFKFNFNGVRPAPSDK